MCSRKIAFLLIFTFTPPLLAQRNCPVPPAVQPVPHEIDMFSDQQEVDLGDAMAENIAGRTKVIEDENLNAYLRALGNRLVQQLPPTNMKFRFYLIDLPEVNAFSITGGRVYVSRKMVALTQNEDELAGVLAHELGHIVTHQTAIFVTARFREVLGVTQVRDRADIFEKFHQYLENAARKPAHGGMNEEKQYVADQVALYAMARAGYAPHAYVDLWDRFQQTHGKTGSWFSDLFGTTKPSERRLREMMKHASAMPAECSEIPRASSTAEFAKWQGEVVSHSIETTRKEWLPGLVFQQELASPLRPDVSYLRFSPDGKYLLAQDEAGIHVITRDPFEELFYIPAANAYDVAFTPDSRSVAFYNRSLRIEKWSIPDQKRSDVKEVTIPRHCLQTALSPDGNALACLNEDFDLSLIDVASSTTIFSKKHFYEFTYGEIVRFFVLLLAEAEGGNPDFIHLGFSPDGRYFLAGHQSAHLDVDLGSRRETSFPGSIKDVTSSSFAFLGPDRIAGVNLFEPEKSPILRFPSGERIGQIRFVRGTHIAPVAHGDYLLVRPIKDYALGVLDLKSNNIPAAVKEPAADVYDGTMVHERMGGELSLDVIATKQHIATLQLPRARLGRLRAAAVSPDFNWMAISNGSRGAVWDVVHNNRVMHVRSFRGAWYGDDDSFYVDFPKFLENERGIGRLVPQTGGGLAGYKVGDVIASQDGRYLVIATSKNKNQVRNLTDADVEIRDVRDGKVLWSHHFAHEVPSFSFDGSNILLRWPVSASAGHDELQRFPELRDRADKEDFFCELVDIQKDTAIGKLLVKTNKRSFHVEDASLAGDWVAVTASGNQVLTYSLASGEEKGHFFGTHPLLSSVSGLVAVENEAGELTIYDLATSQLREKYVFPEPISIKRFSPDGKRLFVLTVNQTVYILDVTVST
jgi:WD40 repeat protein